MSEARMKLRQCERGPHLESMKNWHSSYPCRGHIWRHNNVIFKNFDSFSGLEYLWKFWGTYHRTIMHSVEVIAKHSVVTMKVCIGHSWKNYLIFFLPLLFPLGVSQIHVCVSPAVSMSYQRYIVYNRKRCSFKAVEATICESSQDEKSKSLK